MKGKERKRAGSWKEREEEKKGGNQGRERVEKEEREVEDGIEERGRGLE
jgi:hypothetical protein